MITKDNVFEKLSSTQELLRDEEVMGDLDIDVVKDYLERMDGFLREMFTDMCREQGIDIESALRTLMEKTGDNQVEI